MTHKMPAKLNPASVVAIRDTREQVGLDLSPLGITKGTLATGDYSAQGFAREIAIELKGTLSDLLCCVGRERERFDREMERLRAYPVRALVVESTWGAIEVGQWRNHVSRACVIGSCLGWAADGIPVIMAGDHERAGRYVARLLFIAARRRYRELRTLLIPVEALPSKGSSSRT
jgi:hypothetical protein